MKITPEFALSLVLALGSGFGSYTAIRADLATLHERSNHTQAEAERANRRLDSLIDKK